MERLKAVTGMEPDESIDGMEESQHTRPTLALVLLHGNVVTAGFQALTIGGIS